MKKLAVILLLAAGLASPAMAGTVNFSGITYASAGGGGEFTFKLTSGSLDLSHYSSLTSNIGVSPSF